MLNNIIDKHDMPNFTIYYSKAAAPPTEKQFDSKKINRNKKLKYFIYKNIFIIELNLLTILERAIGMSKKYKCFNFFLETPGFQIIMEFFSSKRRTQHIV
uniref:Uncharacterized protein n=1 Tax=Timema cristinae TaxID=61476 RepID=A0A7R9CC94_TIMCR|nr:unnamed protein product [Timema cristinae]